MSEPKLRLAGRALVVDDASVLLELDEAADALDDPLGAGLFLRLRAPQSTARFTATVGALHGVRRYACGSRRVPFWMTAVAGERIDTVPAETQFLLAELADGRSALFVPLLDGAFRTSLAGRDGGQLALIVDSGDEAVRTDAVTGLFVAVGADPYALCEAAARSVARRIGSARLRREKPLPAFIDQFGWCTWDAFYHDVSHAKVREGLESFAAGGLTPRLLILDDGWQTTLPRPIEGAEGERLLAAMVQAPRNQRLAGFAANAKFPGDLAPTVAMAKDEFGVATFLVWHALAGYWCGVDGEALPGYRVRRLPYRYAPELLECWPDLTDWAGRDVDLVAPEAAHRFFHDYYRHLRAQGVDGVKVDNQNTLEGAGAGSGGRVALLRSYHEAVEGAAQVHFLGTLINCMSCGNDVLYNTPSSSLTRTSDDFFPQRPESHGAHLWNNALVSLWFGEFVHPDWDMFQSGHPHGEFHAIGRVVSGGPVYVSDRPGTQEFDLLRKLVLPDGTTLRPRGIGRPTGDCLFRNPLAEPVLLKIFNTNLEAGVLGVFNAHQPGEGGPLRGVIRPGDVAGLAGERFAVHAHGADAIQVLAREEELACALPPLSAAIYAVVPIHCGVAPIGLADMFNSAGAIEAKGWLSPQRYQVRLRSPGRFLAYCEVAPARVLLNGRSIAFDHDAETGSLECSVPETGVLELDVPAPSPKEPQ